MKISCNVIKDILPLYVENMVSGETREFVDDHLCECSACTAEFNALRNDAKIPFEDDVHSLKYVKARIRKKKYWTVTTAVVLSMTLLTTMLMFLFMPFWLTADEAIENVELMDDGYIKIQTTDLTYGHYGFNTGSRQHYGILEQGIRWRMLYRPQIPPEMNEATHEGYYGYPPSYADSNIYYIDFTDGTVEKLLWDGGNDVMTGQIMFPDNSWGQNAWILETFCYGSAVIGAILFVLAIIFRKFRVFRFLSDSAVLFTGYAVASLIVTNGRYLAHDPNDLLTKLGCILLLTVLFLFSVLCIRKSHSIRMRN